VKVTERMSLSLNNAPWWECDELTNRRLQHRLQAA
jgi:hypothetical protein